MIHLGPATPGGRRARSRRRPGEAHTACRCYVADADLLVTSGGFADNPLPALASLSIGKAGLRSAQTLIAAGVREDGIHAATVTIAGAVKPGTDFDPDNIAELFWTAHTDSKDAWQTEYRFTGA